MNREFFPSCYSDVMSRQYQKITSQQRRFCALEEAIFTVFGRSHNWWGAFSWKGLPRRPSWWNLFSLFLLTQQQELHSGRFLHATFTSQSAKPTQRSALLLPRKWDWASILQFGHQVLFYMRPVYFFFLSKVICLKYDIWCCSVIDIFGSS